MKIKYLFIVLISSFVFIPNMFASSISYNVNIDKNLMFNENNVYNLNKPTPLFMRIETKNE